MNQAPRKTHFEDHAWIHHDPKSPSNGRRSAPLAQHQQELQMNRQIINQPSHSRNGQQRHSPSRQYRTYVEFELFFENFFFFVLIENRQIIR